VKIFALALVVAIGGCSRCGARKEAEIDAGPLPAPTLAPPLNAPKAWTFYRAPPHQYALPEGCSERAPAVRTLVPKTTRFVAEPHALATLVVGESEGDPPKLLAAGALALSADGESKGSTALPWTEAALLPKLARGSANAWIAAIDLPSATPEGPTRVALWRSGAIETLGEGDGFAAIDLVCAEDRCALLTTRLAKVWQPGATVWIGSPKAAPASWKRVDIALTAEATGARLLSLTRVDATQVELAIVGEREVVFWSASDPPHEVARLPANEGVLDASSDPMPIALTHGAPVDEENCPKDPSAPSSLFIERLGLPRIELKVVAPPVSGTIRRAGAGSLVTWLTPTGCRSPHRAAAALAFDEKGAARSPSPTTVGEASGYALAADGTDLDLWFQAEPFVTWVRAKCP
jgi:hypothetical protein